MKMESNRGVNSRTQSMAWNDFPLLSHLSPLPLISQSDKHHKEPIFYIYYSVYPFYITLFCLHILCFKNSLFLSTRVIFLMEGSLIGRVWGYFFGIFRKTKKE